MVIFHSYVSLPEGNLETLYFGGLGISTNSIECLQQVQQGELPAKTCSISWTIYYDISHSLSHVLFVQSTGPFI